MKATNSEVATAERGVELSVAAMEVAVMAAEAVESGKVAATVAAQEWRQQHRSTMPCGARPRDSRPMNCKASGNFLLGPLDQSSTEEVLHSKDETLHDLGLLRLDTSGLAHLLTKRIGFP